MLKEMTPLRKDNLRNDRIWPYIVGAFAMHSMVISALAFSVYGSKNFQNHYENQLIVDVSFQTSSSAENHQDNKDLVPSHAFKGKNEIVSNDGSADHANEVGAEGFGTISPKEKVRESTKRPSQPSALALRISSPPCGSSPLFNPPPIYPREARRQRIEGVVLVQVLLSETGSVTKAKALLPRSNHYLEKAALNAIRQWRFTPGVRTLEVPIEFKLEV